MLEYIKGPQALDWLKEYKAKRLAQQNSCITINMARRAISKGCPHLVKIKESCVSDALELLEWQDLIIDQDVIVYSGGVLFTKDPEIMTQLKLFYS